MVFPKLFNPENGTIKSEGEIMNGRADLREALQIREANALRSNIGRKLQPGLDPVLASHSGIGTTGAKIFWPGRSHPSPPDSGKK